MAHIQTQLHIQSKLPIGECDLEKPFKEVSRIADVVWLPQNLIFEIQCSPITIKEVQARNKDYRSLGFDVVWILHDNRYNSRVLTSIESYLERFPFYYTNIDAAGRGIIYDQFSLIKRNLRSHRLSTLPVDLSQPRENKENNLHIRSSGFVGRIHKRREIWSFYFSGDLIDFTKRDDLEARNLLEKISFIEKRDDPLVPRWRKVIFSFFVRPYKLLFQMILEGFCKS